MKKKIENILSKILIYSLNSYLSIRPTQKFNKDDISNILIYSYNTGIGNFIMYTPAIMSIRDFFPNANFTLLHDSKTGCYVVLKDSGIFNKYIDVKRGLNIIEMIKYVLKIRKENFDMVISEFHNTGLFIILITVFCGAKYRVGHVSSSGWIHPDKWDWIYNIPAKMEKNQHEVERGLELAKAIGIDIKKRNIKPFIYLQESDRDFAKRFLSSNGIEKGNIVISVQIGRKDKDEKHWSLDKYIALCDKILEFQDTKIILHGAPNEYKSIELVVSKMKNNPIIAAGKTTIKQAAALLEKSDVLVCDDSGLMHMAVAVGTPVIAIFGPTDYTRTAPYGKEHTVIKKDFKCIPCSKMDLDPSQRMKTDQCPYDNKCINDITVDELYNVIKKKFLKKE